VNPFREYIDTLESAHMEDEFQKYLNAFKSHSRIIILGNGGSSSVASHISQDYMNSESYGVVECVHQIFLHGVV
jgi:phosphoheptose isomerase